MAAAKETTTGLPSASRGCPAEAEVVAYADGLDLPERDEISRHLRACDDCRRLVGVLASSHDEPSSPGSLPSPAAELLEPGTLIANKYEIVSVIGRGGMGVVLEALHRTLRQRVALKFLIGPLARDPAAVARFFREARAAAMLGSEHVVRVLDADWLPSGEPFLALELLEGRDLAAELRARGPLPIPEAVGYVLEACEALGLAHKHGIVHRDIKPANLFLTRGVDDTPLLKVLDFGIAKVRQHGDTGTGQTDPAAIVGSPRYMAPEQLKASAQVDGRADIWALAVTLFELLTGRVPFEGDNIIEICAAIISGSPARLGALRADVPAGLEQALERAFERDVGRRTATVLGFAEDIAPFAPPASAAGLERLRRITRSSLRPRSEPSSERSLVSSEAVLGSDSTVAAFLTPSADPPGRSTRSILAGAAALAIAGSTIALVGPWRQPSSSSATTADPAARQEGRAASSAQTHAPSVHAPGIELQAQSAQAGSAAASSGSSTAQAVVAAASSTSRPSVRSRPSGVPSAAASASPAPSAASPAPGAAQPMTTSTSALHRDGLFDRK